MQKGSVQLLLVFIAVLIVAFGGWFFYQSKKDNNSDLVSRFTPSKQPQFNDYSNKDLGFEFNHAKNLKVAIDTEEEFNKRGTGSAGKSVNGDFRKNFKGYVGYEPGKFLGAIAVLSKDDDFDNSPFSVWVFDNPDNLGIDLWFGKYWYYPFVWGVFDYTSKGHITPDQTATISGQPAKYKTVTYQPGKPKFMYVSKNKKMYLFKVIEEEGDKILSAFKFLDNTAAGYTCPENGWENCMPILYPEAQDECSGEAIKWKRENCPDFKGVAR